MALLDTVIHQCKSMQPVVKEVTEPETRQDFAPSPRFASKVVALGSLRFDSIFSKATSPRLASLRFVFSQKKTNSKYAISFFG